MDPRPSGVRSVSTCPDLEGRGGNPPAPHHHQMHPSRSMDEAGGDAVDGHGGTIGKRLTRVVERARNMSGRSNNGSSNGDWSARSSVTPERIVQMPTTTNDMKDFLKRISEKCKKKPDVRQALNKSWVNSPGGLEHAVGEFRDTALHAAAGMGLTKVVKCLAEMMTAESGMADDDPDGTFPQSSRRLLDAPNERGYTALHLAVEADEAETVVALIKAGADIEARNGKIAPAELFPRGVTPLQAAVLKGKKESFKILLEHADWRVADSSFSLLHLACFALHVRLSNVDVEEETAFAEEKSDRPKALEKRSGQRKEEAVRTFRPVILQLLNFFAEKEDGPGVLELTDRRPYNGSTVLHYLADFGFEECIEILLKEPFSIGPNRCNDAGLTPLLIAAMNNRFAAIEVLLDHDDTTVDSRDPRPGPQMGFTPLHHLAQNYDKSRHEDTARAVSLLLEKRADPCARNESDETPAHLAVHASHEFLSVFIRFIQDDSELRELLDMTTYETGMTLLHYAAGAMDEDSIHLLITKGASLMAKYRSRSLSARSGGRGANNGVVEAVGNGDIGGGCGGGGGEDDGQGRGGEERRRRTRRREERRVIRGLPLQEAIKTRNYDSYFNAIRRLDLSLTTRWWPEEAVDEFLCAHLVAAARYVRQDVVRALFVFLDRKLWDPPREEGARRRRRLHGVLLYREVAEVAHGYGQEGQEEEGTEVYPEEIYTFTKTGLEWAVQNDDRHVVNEFLQQEKECHPDKKRGLECLQSQVRGGDEILKWTIETFSLFYGMTFFQRRIKPLLCLIPLLFSFFMFVFDVSSDVQLTLAYYQKGFKGTNADPEDDLKTSQETEGTGNSTTTTNADLLLPETGDYRAAFVMNLTCIVLPFFVIFYMCAAEIRDKTRARRVRLLVRKGFLRGAANAVLVPTWLLASAALTPLFLVYMALSRMIHKFGHMKSVRKNEHRGDLQRSEYLWGVARAAEAGFESSPQLFLQLWLLSFHLCALSEEGLGSLGSILDHAVSGFTSFVSLGRKDADEDQKNVAKIVVSFLSLAFTVSSSYKTLKRGSLRYGNLSFIYASNIFQVLGRMISLVLYFTNVRGFLPAIICPLVVHFSAMVVLKFLFDPTVYAEGKFKRLAATVNFFSSSFVNVRIKPLMVDRQEGAQLNNSDRDAESQCVALERMDHVDHHRPPLGHQVSTIDSNFGDGDVYVRTVPSHRTFLTQCLFFALQFAENLVLCLFGLLGQDNRILGCVGGVSYAGLLTGAVVGLWVASCLCHIIYYGFWGHPWSDINGPDRFGFRYYWRGRSRKFRLCGPQRSA